MLNINECYSYSEILIKKEQIYEKLCLLKTKLKAEQIKEVSRIKKESSTISLSSEKTMHGKKMKKVKQRNELLSQWMISNPTYCEILNLQDEYNEIIDIIGGEKIHGDININFSKSIGGKLYNYRLKNNGEWINIIIDILNSTSNETYSLSIIDKYNNIKETFIYIVSDSSSILYDKIDTDFNIMDYLMKDKLIEKKYDINDDIMYKINEYIFNEFVKENYDKIIK